MLYNYDNNKFGYYLQLYIIYNVVNFIQIYVV